MTHTRHCWLHAHTRAHGHVHEWLALWLQVSEIAVETINNKQEAVDWLTYTFFYRRLPQNPNYYNMMGRSHRHIRDHLSELVEDVCAELHDARAILVDETGFNIQPENLGIITAYHHISFKTAHTAHEALSAKVKTKGMITVLSHATEFEGLPIRPGEESAVLRMLKHAKYEVPSLAVDARTKANAVLQAHISRVPLRGDLLVDQREVRAALLHHYCAAELPFVAGLVEGSGREWKRCFS